MIDKFGREITVGCYVVYPTRHGSSTNLKLAKVISVSSTPNKYRPDFMSHCIGVYVQNWMGKFEGKKSILYNPYRVCIVDPPEEFRYDI